MANIDIGIISVQPKLSRRICTAEEPMKEEDKSKYQWGHPDAKYVEPFFNLALYTCPHCNLTFHTQPRPEDIPAE